MAIDFVNDILSKDDGAINKTASKMAELRKKSRTLENDLNAIDNILAAMDTALPDDLPTLQDIDAELADIDADVRAASADVAELGGIAGSCLDGALGALNSIKKDGYSLVADGMNALRGIAGLPAEMADMTDIFNKVKDNINSLGISDLIADINASLGCLSDSSLISDVQNEIAGIQDQIGLSPTGEQDPSAYKQMISNKMGTLPGLDPTYKTFLEDGMSSAAEKSSELGNAAKETMKSSVSAAKNSVPKLPAPPALF